ncbi:hypothetical protein Micbo1qcDRAFT_158904 [Microdochium bolleyi]|uniref:Uncharacterized protein n=1 Tax=Microdochium bolleyi TaxID=196109 RepID=A0A136J9W3_9PEZI|nr:hypothetical protein Micbo1qcDRAFT_158904 [Microdochium bolleyi]
MRVILRQIESDLGSDDAGSRQKSERVAEARPMKREVSRRRPREEDSHAEVRGRPEGQFRKSGPRPHERAQWKRTPEASF